ncbi:MAG: hypothetical protein KAQ79_23530, partial [Cyclobacteriaceae bacterium]|nr:hypothetical protein [Cyclobacteriaceae bacterium]
YPLKPACPVGRGKSLKINELCKVPCLAGRRAFRGFRGFTLIGVDSAFYFLSSLIERICNLEIIFYIQ